MQKRSNKHSHTKRSTFTKIMLASILLLSLSLGSFTVLAADGNISSILKDWFAKKETEVITEIDATVSDVQAEQTERLKTTIKELINDQNEELTQLLETEKQKRTDALKVYADELIREFEMDHSNDTELPILELDAILEDAKEQMDAVAEKEKDEAVNDVSDSDEKNQKVDRNIKDEKEAE